MQGITIHQIIKLLDNVAFLAIVFCLLSLAYDFLLILCGIAPDKKGRTIFLSAIPAKTRFAVVISARNEEKVLPQLFACLKEQAYPHELFDIFLIADNCTDNTAAVGRRLGAFVYERTNPRKRSKGYALTWFFSHMLETLHKKYDHVVIFDADSLVDKQFLRAMDRRIQSGERVLIGYHDTQNPGENGLTGANALFRLIQARFHRQSRNRLGLSVVAISGTGFSFDLDLLYPGGWHTKTITEDVEFGIQMILKGQKICFVREAVFYDIQTSEFVPMLKQRYRWSVGTAQTMRLYLLPLFSKAIRVDNRYFDAFWFLAKIPCLTFVSVLSIIRLLTRFAIETFTEQMIQAEIAKLIFTYFAFVLLLFLLVILEKKSIKDYFKGIFMFPFYGIIWAVIQGIALFIKDTEWHLNTREVATSAKAREDSLI